MVLRSVKKAFPNNAIFLQNCTSVAFADTALSIIGIYVHVSCRGLKAWQFFYTLLQFLKSNLITTKTTNMIINLVNYKDRNENTTYLCSLIRVKRTARLAAVIII